MIIDFHTHVAPEEIRSRAFWKGKCPMTIENVLEAQKVGGIDRTVVSYPYHELREMTDARQQLDAIFRHNRYLASLQKYDTIHVLASTVPHGGDAFLREFERAVKEDGCKGAIIMSSLQGHYPDDDDAFPFFELAVDLTGFSWTRLIGIIGMERTPEDAKEATQWGADCCQAPSN